MSGDYEVVCFNVLLSVVCTTCLVGLGVNWLFWLKTSDALLQTELPLAAP